MKKSAVVMTIVLIVLLIPSGFINLRRGVHMGDRFYMPSDNGDNSWTYRSEPGYEVMLDWCGTGTGCGVMTDWSEQSVQLDWTGDWASLEFEDGTVLEGQWTGEALIDAEGKPLWMNDDEEESIIQIVVGDETDKGLRKYTIACALCKMDRRELVSFGSVWIMLLGAAIYGFGMLNILYPEKMHFLGNRWRYERAELSDAGYMSQVFGGIALLIVGVIGLYLPLIG